ncbi:MAG: RidA family protein [Planctomycetaceae bacterium]
MTSRVETKLQEMGHRLPAAPEAVGAYLPVLRTGNLVVTSGQLPVVGKEIVFRGRVGDQLHVDDGANAARIAALNALAQIKAVVGDLDHVKRIVRVEGYVQSAPGFDGHSLVVNGASQLIVDAFGEAGRHTRVALGMSSLPLNAAVEIVIWAEV